MKGTYEYMGTYKKCRSVYNLLGKFLFSIYHFHISAPAITWATGTVSAPHEEHVPIRRKPLARPPLIGRRIEARSSHLSEIHLPFKRPPSRRRRRRRPVGLRPPIPPGAD